MPVFPLVGSRMIVSGLISPRFLGRVDHGHPDAVLHAVRRVEEFQLGDDVGDRAVGDPVQPDQRRVSDELCDVLGDAHENFLHDIGTRLVGRPGDVEYAGASTGLALEMFL